MPARIAIAALTILLSCSPSTPGDRSELRSASLLYLKGRILNRVDLETGRTARVGDFPTQDVYAPPVPPYIAYVVGTDGPTEDFVQGPELRVLDLESRRESVVGTGVTPIWDPGGTALAFLRPVKPLRCEAESCAGLREVAVFDPATEKTQVIGAPGRWTLLGWAGTRVLAADADDLDSAVSLGAGRPIALPLAPSEVWGGSPDGRWVLATGRGRTRFLELRPDGTPTGKVVIVAVGGRLAEGEWTADSRLVAVVNLEPSGGRRAVVFGPTAPTPVTIPGSKSASGPLLWAGDKWVVLTGVSPGGRSTTSLCPLDEKGCGELFSWGRGVVLLRTEGKRLPQAE
jgi:hypothetical protein